VATGEPLLIPHIELAQVSAQVNPALLPMLEKVGLTSVIVVCLRAREKRLGFIGLSRMGKGRPAYNEDDLALAQDLADRAALAIENARLVDELELRVAARTAQLEAANAELESFCYSVSHDLRAPLRAIDGFSQILQLEHSEHLDTEGERIISVIRKNSQRMGQLIDDLLRFSRLGRAALRLTDVAMGPLAEAAWAEVRDPAREITIVIDELATVSCDRELMRQVWTNLLGNAVKYTRDRPDAQIHVACSVDANEARFEVEDNGDGYDPRHADKLFKVFQRLHGHTEFEGTGVGLALVARIVGRHGGRVWAEGRPKQGATFGFSLPRVRVQ
ncbi:MAG TPA: ATP-binding protein, partial [Nannocystaceae bacterium]|nr:ATP-binding protein [Nannocystaceae bacterium]